MHICFITLGDISQIATMKRAFGMATPLIQLGWRVSIIALDCEENRKRYQLECEPEVQIMYYHNSSVWNEIKQKTRLVERLRPDYLYFCSFSARNLINLTILSFNPKCIVEHSELPSQIPNTPVAKRISSLFFEYSSIWYADLLVCASKFLMNTYTKRSKQLFKATPLLYSPYAFNPSVINAPKRIFKQLKQRYLGYKVVLYLGTITRNYGFFTMLEAMKQLRNPTVKLLFLGEGRDLEEGKTYSKNNYIDTQVEFLGYVAEEDLSSYFSIADAFISPLQNTVQDKARCPSKIYMYLPFNKPVFTCAIGEAYQIFGENGFYFEEKDPSTLADLLKKLTEYQFNYQPVNISTHSWQHRVQDFHQWLINLTYYDASRNHPV